MTKYIVLDTELGGAVSGTSLLTAYFHIATKNADLLTLVPDSLSLNIKHDVYNVTAEGMSVNHIDLIEHDKIAEYKGIAGKKLYDFLKRTSDQGKNKLVPLGHGIAGDLDYIYSQLLGRETWEQFCSYRRIDTGVVARFMQDLGTIPEDLDCSLASLVDYFQIDMAQHTKSPLHTANADAIATWLVYYREIYASKLSLTHLPPDLNRMR